MVNLPHPTRSQTWTREVIVPRSVQGSKSKRVYTSGISETEKAVWDDGKPRVMDSTTAARSSQLNSVQEPSPSQRYTFQRGLAKAALKLPEPERELTLAKALAAMGLLERIFRP